MHFNKGTKQHLGCLDNNKKRHGVGEHEKIVEGKLGKAERKLGSINYILTFDLCHISAVLLLNYEATVGRSGHFYWVHHLYFTM